MPRKPTCHPDRPHHARGLCLACYAAHVRPEIARARYWELSKEERQARRAQMRERASERRRAERERRMAAARAGAVRAASRWREPRGAARGPQKRP